MLTASTFNRQRTRASDQVKRSDSAGRCKDFNRRTQRASILPKERRSLFSVAGEHALLAGRADPALARTCRIRARRFHDGPGEHAPCDPHWVDPGPSTKPAEQSLPTCNAVGRIHDIASIRTGLDKLVSLTGPNSRCLCAGSETQSPQPELRDCPICPTPSAEFVRSIMLASRAFVRPPC